MFPSTFPPPSRAATSMARSSFEYIRPRFSSVADFFRLMEAHFECPDIALPLFGQLEQLPMHPGVAGDLRMKGRGDQIALADHHRPATVSGQHIDALAHSGYLG